MVEIKQMASDNPNQEKYKTQYGEFTMQPFSARSFPIRKTPDNLYITGLTEEQEERLSRRLGQSLSPTSEFWKGYRLKFHMPSGTMQIDERTPLGEIFLAVAKANKLLAEDRDELESDMILRKNTIFYIDNKEEKEKKKVQIMELKHEATALIYKMRNNKDKMLFTLFKLGKYVTEQLKVDSLYAMLSAELEKMTRVDKLRNFKKVLELPNESLQASYYVSKGIDLRIIPMDSDVRKYKYLDKIVGETKSKAEEYFSDKKNELALISLINEVKEQIG